MLELARSTLLFHQFLGGSNVSTDSVLLRVMLLSMPKHLQIDHARRRERENRIGSTLPERRYVAQRPGSWIVGRAEELEQEYKS